ncbi:MAG: ABC transporter ATP-binding protein [Desulfuromusa sp.]|nr:ABC transporter ATP-binding protein [Desulfuromusa sp.]
MTPAIKIEQLSKRYFIGHQRQQKHDTFRDLLMHNFRSLGQRIRHPLSPNAEVIEQEELWALRDINLEIRQGDRVGIIGRNGAGKSTLLKILSRITEPTEGRFTMNGRVASLLEVGTGFHPELTGRENIFLNGAILGMSKTEIRRKFNEIVAFAETEKFLDTPVKRYSSGMYVRLAFAVAAHLEPEILIVDEVLAVGDSAFQKKCLGKMKEVSSEGRTILFVSHNMGAIASLCSKVALMDKGKIDAYDDTQKVIHTYISGIDADTPYKTFPQNPNKSAQIQSVRLLNEQGSETNNISISKPAIVEVSFVLRKAIEGCHVACIISTHAGTHVFSTADTDLQPELLGKREAGEYVAAVKIPIENLNVGTYLVSIGIGIPGREVIDRQEAISFVIHDTGSFSSMKEGGGRAGLLVFQVPWNYTPSIR